MTTTYANLIAPYTRFINESTDDIGDVTLAIAIIECHIQDSLNTDIDMSKE